MKELWVIDRYGLENADDLLFKIFMSALEVFVHVTGTDMTVMSVKVLRHRFCVLIDGLCSQSREIFREGFQDQLRS